MNLTEINQKVKKHVDSVLENCDSLEPPINLHKIAEKHNISLLTSDFSEIKNEKISGAIFISNGKQVILVNKNDAPVRRRFTIGHELGHFFMHSNYEELTSEDKIFFRFDDTQVLNDEDKIKEIEANIFSANLLMPYEILKDCWRRINAIYPIDESYKIAARVFNVSEIALRIRLNNAGLI